MNIESFSHNCSIIPLETHEHMIDIMPAMHHLPTAKNEMSSRYGSRSRWEGRKLHLCIAVAGRREDSAD